ncbi:hypothetical protein [Staphylococcus chromogenes]|uniref:hypothetical protein n=1 Tax=Staphylococcus chromogenes TaxID=46126 RepID=UPI000D1CBCE7|nr:hypothetical protein [Staphylococcus chromogenes]PTF68557.1 hypothetical protein BUY03_09270 [Staphylococcus chromogenes]
MPKRNKDFYKALDKLEKNAKNMHGTTNVDFDELFNENFMKKYTNKINICEFIESSGLNVHTQDDFNNISSTPEWQHYVNENSRFSTWSEMYKKAVGEYSFKRLFDGI